MRRIYDSASRSAMVLAVFAYLFSGTVAAIDLRVVAPNAVREVVSETAARYERVSGNRTVLTWGGSEAIAKRVADGSISRNPESAWPCAQANRGQMYQTRPDSGRRCLRQNRLASHRVRVGVT
jgi:hypothetical protein